MISKFFIDRPIFATVLSLLIVLGGTLAIYALPVAQFPEVVPPSVSITASYPGADAATVAATLAAPIEQELSGAKGLLYYQSTCANNGSLTTTVTFEIGSDLDIAAVEVQNRVKKAEPRLPQEALRQGITVTKKSDNMVLIAVLTSTDPRYDQLYLTNYATLNLLDSIKRVPGVGDAMVFGAGEYAMRVWLNPDSLAAKGMSVSDVTSAIQEQNGLYAAGRIGQRPTDGMVELTVPVTTRGRLDTPEQFAAIILRSESNGAVVRLGDVARVELGSQVYDQFGRLNGQPTALLMTYLQTGANALETAKGIEEALHEAAPGFPAGISYSVPYDTTKFIEVSIEAVIHTLIEAVILVLIVVFLFLQSWRTTIIPLLAVPVAIVGTFAGLMAFGFSINTLSLFGLVLAIGIVVDDAIVVVENVERIMRTTHKSVYDSTVQAMQEVTGPVIAIVLVLSAVFIPVAFLGGLTGAFYKQFAITIAVSVAISGLVALTLSPALCVLLLKPHDPAATHSRNPLTRFLGWFFGWFNRGFDAMTSGYTATVRISLRFWVVGVVLFCVLGFTTVRLFSLVPGGFIPEEDQGNFACAVILPSGASLDRTDALVKQVEEHFRADPAVANVIALGGLNLLANGSISTDAATIFVTLKDWKARKTPELGLRAIITRAYLKFAQNPAGLVLPFNMPPVPGLGTRVGFEVQLQDRAGLGIEALATASQQFVAGLAKDPAISQPSQTFSLTQPQLQVDVDRDQIKAMGLPVSEVFSSLQTYLGSLYVNDFTKFGRVYRVQVQAEPSFRSDPASLGRIQVRNQGGELVPLEGVLTSHWKAGPNLITRFNGFPSVKVTGASAPGFSTGDAMVTVREVAKDLPQGMAYAWSGSSYQEVKAGSQLLPILSLGMLVVFLILAAQYESWAQPLAVMLAVPFGLFGALGACWLVGLPNNIYVQIGLLVLVGLAAKNAILIVEFAAEQHREGKPLFEAALEAARLRFRPILMTSLAFILGVVPLVLSSGAGAAGRVSIGIGVCGGMIAATVFAVFLVPLFYYLVMKVSGKK